MTERLQKIIASSGLMSRRAAEEKIAAGQVTVNGQTAHLGDRADIDVDMILVDGRPLPPTGEKQYIMLNKPRGYVTTLHDEKRRKNVTELVKGLNTRLYPAGRLDMYSEGLLILTNDGDFANKLMHPSGRIGKTYHVWVRGENAAERAELLRQPMEIDGYRVRGAEVVLLAQFEEGAVLAVTIGEGRNRQVRKMCDAAGLKVTKLLRVSEGPLRLGDLETGCWRPLTQEEIERVMEE